MDNLKVLTIKERLEISGGRPTTETSFFYDLGWYVGAAVRKVESWLK